MTTLEHCKAVCLTLGPYRNLTTLTASVLFLHPQCQVLNHAGARIFGTDSDFLSTFSTQRLDNFIPQSVALSAEGQRGDYGGSITLSHAFDDGHEMKRLFSAAQLSLVKAEVRGLFWKESHRTANLIREHDIDLAAMFAADPRPRFLMPIRNPMDCAQSNIKTGHVQLFTNVQDKTDLGEVTEAVLDEIRWFFDLQKQFPGRFFHFYEHSINRAMLVDMERFMALDHDERWLDLALQAMSSKAHYDHPAELLQRYEKAVDKKFSTYPEAAEKLLAFA